MISITNNVDLFPYNTFHLHSIARNFVTITSIADAIELFRSEIFRSHDRLILGGGSNMLLTRDFDGLVIKNELKGIETVTETDDKVVLKVASGENWHQFVLYCVSRDLGGVENLSLIPGTMGAAPMQNIGAYGVEIKEVIESVEAIELSTGKLRQFTRDECLFGYRESIFKQELKNQYFISSITLSVTKKNHRFNTSYGAITDVLKQNHVETLTVKAISDAVISIRKSKLPDPEVIGNAGSFFKNPSVDFHFYEALKSRFPSVPSFPGEKNLIKIPAGWLIEMCGWKGKTFDNIGVHKHQALVLVNYGGGKGSDIWQLARDIQQSVKEKFQIDLHAEVNIV